MRSELLTLSRDMADRVSRHLVAAGQIIDEDAELALQHAIAARRIASRIAVVREAVGLAAYAAGDWATAIAELRTYHRMTGKQTHLAEIADSERALGRPERAIDLFRGADRESLDKTSTIELLIVAAGARGDLGQHDAAVAMLQVRELTAEEDAEWAARLRYAYADALLAAGRREEAREWFSRAAVADTDETTDAAERLLELDGVTLTGDEEDEDDDTDGDAEARADSDDDEDDEDDLDGDDDVEARADSDDEDDEDEGDDLADGAEARADSDDDEDLDGDDHAEARAGTDEDDDLDDAATRVDSDDQLDGAEGRVGSDVDEADKAEAPAGSDEERAGSEQGGPVLTVDEEDDLDGEDDLDDETRVKDAAERVSDSAPGDGGLAAPVVRFSDAGAGKPDSAAGDAEQKADGDEFTAGGSDVEGERRA